MAKADGDKPVAEDDFTKYRVDEAKRKRFPKPIFKKVHLVSTTEVEKFYKRNGRLPEHVYPVQEKKS